MLRLATCLLFGCVWWSLCCGFVLLSSATGAGAGEASRLFTPGGGWTYKLQTDVLLNDRGSGGTGKDVGFLITAQLTIESKWGSGDERLLKLKLEDPKLHIRSRKSPTPEGFVEHTSILETLSNNPFYILLEKGRIEKILLAKGEPLSLSNLKKGISSLLQVTNRESEETDSSGRCTATYQTPESHKIIKTKSNCSSTDLQLVENPDVVLGVTTKSSQIVTYVIGESHLNNVESDETHEVFLNAKEEVGNVVRSSQKLQYVGSHNTDVLAGHSFDAVFETINNKEGPFTEESLLTELELVEFEDAPKKFNDLLAQYKDNLKISALGSLSSAKSFLAIISVARKANKDAILKVLKGKKNQKILHQVYDILGYVQTSDSHAAVTQRLHFDDETQEELVERYLWALSFSPQPNPEVVIDLLNKFKKTQNIPEKISETLIMAIGAMGHNLEKLNKDNVVHREIERTIVDHLNAAAKEARYPFLRALRNFKSASTIPALLKIVNGDNLKEGVLAWKALRAMEPDKITSEVLNQAAKTFFQINAKHDSSSRTLSLDILLESKPNEELLKHIVEYLLSNDAAYEIKQYTIQRLNMLSQTCGKFGAKLRNVMEINKKFYSYDAWGQRGLSVSLTRSFMEGPSGNGSLLTVQEMHGGIVKQGVVNVVMDKDEVSKEIFSLGVFTGGLGSFLSSEASEGGEEYATAGMELSVLGNQIRPFRFFNGQGELMSHVWAGTASERTAAFQAIAMLHDHLQYIRLGSGFIAEIDIKGATSFDLSGQIQFSLWNRNAESLVEKSAGITTHGLLRIDSAFVRSQVEFSLSVEPKLKLQADIEFSSGVHLCMRLTQPETVYRHNIYKIERIPGSKHRLRKTKHTKHLVPGKTYALNRKNTDMCNMIFS